MEESELRHVPWSSEGVSYVELVEREYKRSIGLRDQMSRLRVWVLLAVVGRPSLKERVHEGWMDVWRRAGGNVETY